MNALERLRETSRRLGNFFCLGMDPVPERLESLVGDGSLKTAEHFLNVLWEELNQEGWVPAAVKPNLAYFEQYGASGVALLERLISLWKRDTFVILDAKRGDIGRSSRAYARSAFEVLGGDAVTVSPWMGRDSLEPFLEYCSAKIVYVLLKTSNPGAEDLQDLLVYGELPHREAVWQRLHWLVTGAWYRKGLGVVVGATRLKELQWVVDQCRTKGLVLPLLLPGVGAQGAEPKEVAEILSLGGEIDIHRVNVSSSVLYAAEKSARFKSGSVLSINDAVQYSLEAAAYYHGVFGLDYKVEKGA